MPKENKVCDYIFCIYKQRDLTDYKTSIFKMKEELLSIDLWTESDPSLIVIKRIFSVNFF